MLAEQLRQNTWGLGAKECLAGTQRQSVHVQSTFFFRLTHRHTSGETMACQDESGTSRFYTKEVLSISGEWLQKKRNGGELVR